jgi:hypothetical protein
VTLLLFSVPEEVGKDEPCGVVGREQDARKEEIAAEAPIVALPTASCSIIF